MTNYFYPQRELLFKVRNGAKVTKAYDRQQTPMFRADAHQAVLATDKSRLAEQLRRPEPGRDPAADSGLRRWAPGSGYQQRCRRSQA